MSSSNLGFSFFPSYSCFSSALVRYSEKIIWVKNDDIFTEPTTFIFLNYWIHQPIAQILRKWRLSSFRRPRTLLSLDLHEILLRFERPPYAKKIKRELKCAQTKKERKSVYPVGDFLFFTCKYDNIQRFSKCWFGRLQQYFWGNLSIFY